MKDPMAFVKKNCGKVDRGRRVFAESLAASVRIVSEAVEVAARSVWARRSEIALDIVRFGIWIAIDVAVAWLCRIAASKRPALVLVPKSR